MRKLSVRVDGRVVESAMRRAGLLVYDARDLPFVIAGGLHGGESGTIVCPREHARNLARWRIGEIGMQTFPQSPQDAAATFLLTTDKGECYR